MSLWNLILTLVMQRRATRNVPKAVAKVKTFLFLLRNLKSSDRPVITASMPPIWWTQKEIDIKNRIKILHHWKCFKMETFPWLWLEDFSQLCLLDIKHNKNRTDHFVRTAQVCFSMLLYYSNVLCHISMGNVYSLQWYVAISKQTYI